MGTLYIDTGGAATNSGSTDNNSPDLSGTADATVAGSVVTLTALTDLTAVVTTAGPTQSSIYLADATNTNRKIFWITAKADSGGATPNVTVDVAPTGVVASNWAIGGRCVLTNASQEGALRAGDEVIFNNSPAAAAAVMWTFRIAGDSTSGPAKIRGKTGVRPVLNTTNTSVCVGANSLFNCMVENLELDQDGASGTVLSGSSNTRVVNVKVSDGGGSGFGAAGGFSIITSEITGVGADGVNIPNGSSGVTFGCYIHDNTGDGIEDAGANNGPEGGIYFSILDTNAGRGIFLSGAHGANSYHPFDVLSCTAYGNGNSGLEVTDADTVTRVFDNIFQNNGDAAGEFNVEWAAGQAEYVSSHAYNCFNKSSNNVSGLTVNSTEITTDPLFTDAANGNFTLSSSSPCKATGFPGQFLGGSLGYLDMGAVQRQESGGGGVAARIIGA